MSISRALAIGSLSGVLFFSCSTGNEAGVFGGDMYVVSCSLGCTNGSAGDQVFCSIVNTFQNQEISILFSQPLDISSVNASSFRVVNVAVGTSPIGTFIGDPLNPRRLVFRPSLAFDGNGNPLFGFSPGTAYQITIPGTQQGDGPPFIKSVAGRNNRSRLQCTILTDQGVIDPVPGLPSVEVKATVVTGYDADGNPDTFLPDQIISQDPELVDVFRLSQLDFAFNDVMNPATLANPVTKQSAFIRVLVDGDGDLATTADRVPIAGEYDVSVNQDLLTTFMTFVPSVGYPSAGPVGQAPLRRIVIDIPDDVIDLVGNPILPANGGGLISFFPERIDFDPVVLPRPGGEKFEDQSLEDAAQSSAFWGQGRLAPGIGGGSGRLGALRVPTNEVVVLNTDSQVFPIGTGVPDFLGNPGLDGNYPGQAGGTQSIFTVDGGVFEFSSIVVENGGRLTFEGSNPPRLYSRGRLFVASGGKIDVSGGTPAPHDSTIALPEMGMDVDTTCNGNTTVWTLDDANTAVGLGGPAAGDGGFGADRYDFNGNVAMLQICVGMQFQPEHNPLNFVNLGIVPDNNGRAGQGVGGFPDSSAGLGGLKYPNLYPPSILTATSMAFPTDLAFNIIGVVVNGMSATECLSRMVGGPGSGGGYSTPGSNGIPVGEPFLAEFPMGIVNGGAETPGGTIFPALGSEPPSETNNGYVIRTLDGDNLRGGAGGGGGGNHPFNTFANGQSANPPVACVSNNSLLREWHDHSGAPGGGGGGAVGLTSGKKIEIDGVVDAAGGQGGSPFTSGEAIIAGINPFGAFAAPGGGGSGGAVRMQSIEIELSGAPGRVTVSGGLGGQGVFSASSGGQGGAGLVRIETLDAGQTPSQLRAILAPSILPFNAMDNSLGWVSAAPGAWSPGGVRPESVTASVSCWMKPEGNYFALDFDSDAGTTAATQGWNMNVLYQPSPTGPIFTVPFRGSNPDPTGPFGTTSWEAMFGNVIQDGGDDASPIAVRFQGAQLVQQTSNLCDVLLTGIQSPVLAGSVTPWVLHPDELNDFVPRPNMIRFAVLFDGTNEPGDDPGLILDSVLGINCLFIKASPN